MTDALPPRSSLGRGLSTIGVVVIGFEITRRFVLAELPVLLFMAAAASVVTWIALLFLTRRRLWLVVALLVVMVLSGGIAATSTDGVEIVPAAVAIAMAFRDLRIPIPTSLGVAALGLIAVPLGLLIVPQSLTSILSMEAGLLVALLAGQSRRQALLAERQARQLLEAALVAREEQARVGVLVARQHIAHDIHDVLAHSLGGLVIQLDAVDALLESGDAAGAAARVRDARALAADGLSEARRAVAALRDGPADADVAVAGDELVDGLQALLTAHRSLGGRAELSEWGERHEITAALGSALHRAVQEGMTNARKHAPGQPVMVRLDWGPGDVAVRIENPLVGGVTDVTGGGHGLVGMRERFAALPGGVATAAVESGAFVVRVGGGTA
jgi:signal transduction histidine kinase